MARLCSSVGRAREQKPFLRKKAASAGQQTTEWFNARGRGFESCHNHYFIQPMASPKQPSLSSLVVHHLRATTGANDWSPEVLECLRYALLHTSQPHEQDCDVHQTANDAWDLLVPWVLTSHRTRWPVVFGFWEKERHLFPLFLDLWMTTAEAVVLADAKRNANTLSTPLSDRWRNKIGNVGF